MLWRKRSESRLWRAIARISLLGRPRTACEFRHFVLTPVTSQDIDIYEAAGGEDEDEDEDEEKKKKKKKRAEEGRGGGLSRLDGGRRLGGRRAKAEADVEPLFFLPAASPSFLSRKEEEEEEKRRRRGGGEEEESAGRVQEVSAYQALFSEKEGEEEKEEHRRAETGHRQRGRRQKAVEAEEDEEEEEEEEEEGDGDGDGEGEETYFLGVTEAQTVTVYSRDLVARHTREDICVSSVIIHINYWYIEDIKYLG
ncbi:hypothetical protein TRV_07800 [Trichophyton verrucosum HKI 0517]|uniref:Uncharacterized protein n=1 Tax=Trichophyton verrucosum (strain HKI 0517) TaxID=663202 RepID=D4DKS6_TRIVH|nr:uncharacterized protein TRV_07800 [Trichophyton verrucosum HKI 0517]EFE37552.1 hypothetical protein TRV_07800 [Trichophyton verrucosum HKI 0517]